MEITVLAKGHNGSKAMLISSLLYLGIWDDLTVADREAWCERAEVLDTPGGNILFGLLQRRGLFE